MLDLHLHSLVSDGTEAPRVVVERAAKRGVSTLALTDHDTIGGVEEAMATGRELGVDVWTGIEISATDDERRSVHVLGYGFELDDLGLREALTRLVDRRDDRNEQIVTRLRALGMSIDLDEVRKKAQGTVGRPHLARALIEAGFVKSFEEAFDRWLGEGRRAYVPRPMIDPRGAVEVLHRAGGLASLAHPVTLARDPIRSEALIRKAESEGFDAIEVNHPSQSPGERNMLRWFASRYGLLLTGGSDQHGPEDPIEAAPDEWLGPLVDRLRAVRRSH
ncbi:MAG: PHP domain-containing protein [Deltaproteobacteria bacterium]|nr:PHP domain-containing protein [Deltaproteobacteria bacterium]